MAPVGCGVCGKTTNLTCNNCKAAAYCSLKCHDRDKPLHERICEETKLTLLNLKRPNLTTKIGMAFDDQESFCFQPRIFSTDTMEGEDGSRTIFRRDGPFNMEPGGKCKSFIHEHHGRRVEICTEIWFEDLHHEQGGIHSLIRGGLGFNL